MLKRARKGIIATPHYPLSDSNPNSSVDHRGQRDFLVENFEASMPCQMAAVLPLPSVMRNLGRYICWGCATQLSLIQLDGVRSYTCYMFILSSSLKCALLPSRTVTYSRMLIADARCLILQQVLSKTSIYVLVVRHTNHSRPLILWNLLISRFLRMRSTALNTTRANSSIRRLSHQDVEYPHTRTPRKNIQVRCYLLCVKDPSVSCISG